MALDWKEHHPVVQLVVDVEEYLPQTVPQFDGNPYIGALPYLMSTEQILQVLTDVPTFRPADRELPTEVRFAMIMRLSAFFLPFGRHVRLANMVEALLRQSYVGRAPNSAGYVQSLQDLYRNRMRGLVNPPTPGQFGGGLSTSLIGVAGCGKSTLLQRIQAAYPPALRHVQHAMCTQMPIVILQCPANGATVRGLALQFFEYVDSIFGTDYEATYTKSGSNEDTLSTAIASVALRHGLGLLVIEEIQNVTYAKKGEEKRLPRFFRLLVNKVKSGILFVGTNKAYDIVEHDFSEARRSIGYGSEYWDRYVPHWYLDERRQTAGLAPMTADDKRVTPDEFTPFLKVLWARQLTRKFTELDHTLERTMFRLTQGVADIIIKLFVAAQREAMLDGSEQLSVELIERVFERGFKPVEPMLKALESGDPALLRRFDDLKPLQFDALLAMQEGQFEASRNRAANADALAAKVALNVAAALQRTGAVSPEVAEKVAQEVVASGETDALRGLKKAVTTIEPPAKRRNKSNGTGPSAPDPTKLPEGDLRRLFWEAKQAGEPVATRLMEVQKPHLDALLGA